MADAKVIPFDEDGRGRRGAKASKARSGRKRPEPAQRLTQLPSAANQAAHQAAAEAAADGAAEPPRGPGRPDGAGHPDEAGQGPAGGRAEGPEDGGPAPDPGSAGSDSAPDSDSAQGSGPAPEGDASDRRDDAGEHAGAQGIAEAFAQALNAAADRLIGGGWEDRLARGLSFLRRRVTGDYEVDEFGYDPELTDQVFMSIMRPLFRDYFRVEVRGIENIPDTGGALVVANHSGTLPLDALMAQVAVHDHHPRRRHLRLLGADLVFVLPVVGELARKAGHTLACAEDAQLLLERGEVVGVMPEGFKGLGKPFSERYKLQRFGRGGFVSTALRTGVPIVPCSIVGAEEVFPMVGNSKTLARLLGFPYFPITPTFPWLGPLGAIPLPTKWTIQFGEPIPTDSYPAEAAEDPMLVFDLTDQVREIIQHTLYKLLVQRRSVFF